MKLCRGVVWALVLLWLGMRTAHDDVVPYAGSWAPYVAIAVAVLTLVAYSTVWVIRCVEAIVGNGARALGDELVWIIRPSDPRGER